MTFMSLFFLWIKNIKQDHTDKLLEWTCSFGELRKTAQMELSDSQTNDCHEPAL